MTSFDQGEPADPGRSVDPPTAPNPTTSEWPAERVAVLAGAIATAVGAFLPWIKATTVFTTIDKTGVEGDGIATLAVAVIVGLVAMVKPGSRTWPFFGAIGIIGIGLGNLQDALERVGDINGSTDLAHASVGSGLWLTLAGGAVILFGCWRARTAAASS